MDIAITKSQQREREHIVAVINVKMVMSNYSQNKNNYFESMLGETANLRSAGGPLLSDRATAPQSALL